MTQSDKNNAFELLREKYNRHEKILIQAYKSIKQKEKELKELNEELRSSEEELKQLNEELYAANEELFYKSDIIYRQNAELKEAFENLKETQSQLMQTEKMTSLGTLTAGVSHEINNPLNYILGGYEGLQNYVDSNGIKDENVQLFLHSIKVGVERAASIIRGLNQFSRSSEDYNEDCQIHDIISNCLVMLDNQLKERIEVKKNFVQNSILVLGNVGKLHHVFINILSNSIQATIDQGSITIETKRTGKNAIIEISDTGCGICAENLKKITDPFFTTKDPGMGTGLGLSATLAIIHEHKGKLTFTSELNKGTTVKITLPIKTTENE